MLKNLIIHSEFTVPHFAVGDSVEKLNFASHQTLARLSAPTYRKPDTQTLDIP